MRQFRQPGLGALVRGYDLAAHGSKALDEAPGTFDTVVTASTSFANPAVTVPRALTQTFAGIRPDDVAAFALAQVGSAILATGTFEWLLGGHALKRAR